jgi:hypothetical protein
MAQLRFAHEERMPAEHGVFLLADPAAPNPEDDLAPVGTELLRVLADGATVVFFCQGDAPAPHVRLEVWDAVPGPAPGWMSVQDAVVRLGAGTRGLTSLLGGGAGFRFPVPVAGPHGLRAHRSRVREATGGRRGLAGPALAARRLDRPDEVGRALRGGHPGRRAKRASSVKSALPPPGTLSVSPSRSVLWLLPPMMRPWASRWTTLTKKLDSFDRNVEEALQSTRTCAFRSLPGPVPGRAVAGPIVIAPGARYSPSAQFVSTTSTRIAVARPVAPRMSVEPNAITWPGATSAVTGPSSTSTTAPAASVKVTRSGERGGAARQHRGGEQRGDGGDPAAPSPGRRPGDRQGRRRRQQRRHRRMWGGGRCRRTGPALDGQAGGRQAERALHLAQRFAEGERGRRAVLRVLGHRPLEHPADGVRDALAAQVRHRGVQHARDRLQHLAGRPGERRGPGEQAEQRRAERVDVRLRAAGPPVEDLGRRVRDARRDHAGAGAGTAEHVGDPEVGEQRLAVAGHEHVLGLDVAVQHPGPVRGLHGAGELHPVVEHPVDRQRPAAAQLVGERAVPDVLHREERRAVRGDPAVVDRDDVRVVRQRAERHLLTLEPRERLRVAVRREQQLDGDGLPQREPRRAVDDGEAAAPDLLLGAVAGDAEVRRVPLGGLPVVPQRPSPRRGPAEGDDRRPPGSVGG